MKGVVRTRCIYMLETEQVLLFLIVVRAGEGFGMAVSARQA